MIVGKKNKIKAILKKNWVVFFFFKCLQEIYLAKENLLFVTLSYQEL